ncbi:MAG: structural protein P5 [Bacteroidaceae bacterium]|nr:structural protein P5 [Bacteroidaceae bacterium]
MPRGIRNNNPLNIRIGNVWLGEVKESTDNEFEQFISMFYGVRAGFILLRRYINRYHLNTIALIISRWAPGSENNTVKYVDTVCRLSGMQPDTQLTYTSEEQMVSLVDAMIFVECGQHIDRATILKAYRGA